MRVLKRLFQRAPERLQALLPHFPVRNTAITLWERFNQDKLALSASSLTYTTLLGVVPLFAVVLAIFTVFPKFQQFEEALERWLINNFVPQSISSSVLAYLNQFSSQASGLGTLAVLGLVFTTLSMIYTIDQTFNDIWRVREARPWSHRLLLYWAALTLGPIVVGGSVVLTSLATAQASGWMNSWMPGLSELLAVVQFALLVLMLGLLFRLVPNTPVRWSHALAGSLFATTCMQLGRWAVGWYVSSIPTYSLIYGAFAIVPILLIWVYMAWVFILLGAVIAAYLPSLLAGVARRPSAGGWQFQVALEVLQLLARARSHGVRGRSLTWLARRLQLDEQQAHPVLEVLQEMNWVAPLAEKGPEPRWVLLLDPAQAPLSPLVTRFLFRRNASTEAVWQQFGIQNLLLSDVIDDAQRMVRMRALGLGKSAWQARRKWREMSDK